MPDIVSAAVRSRMMAGIRSKNTRPEIAIRKRLHRIGFRYRIHGKLPGKPDLVFPQYNAVVFVHGCFWHGHDCRLFRPPGIRRDFWLNKISQNRQRDKLVLHQLRAAGWRTLTIWECAIRGKGAIGMDRVIAQTSKWLQEGLRDKIICGACHGAL